MGEPMDNESNGMRKALLLFALASLGASAGPATAQTGWGLALVGRDLYFPTLERGQVVRLRDGSMEVLIDDIHCHSVAPGYDGAVYAESVGTGAGGTGDVVALWRLGPGQRREHHMPPVSRPLPGEWVARDGAGASYSWHGEGERRSRIYKRTATGEVSVLAGDRWGLRDGVGGDAQFGAVGGIAATADGVLFVTDGGHLRRIAPDGTVSTVARDIVSLRTGGLPGDFGLFNRSVGLAVDGNERVFIVDAYNLRVVRWDAAAGAVTVWSTSNWLSRATGGGLATVPRGVAIDGQEVYVLEAVTTPSAVAALVGTPRIRRIGPDGRNELVFTMASRPLQLAVVVTLVVGGLWWIRRRHARDATSD